MLQTTQFLGLECVQIENATLSLLVTKSVGPRILGLKFHGEENMLAEMPATTVKFSESGEYHMYGGHRLWHAPEALRRTYIPDDDPLEIESRPDGLQVTQPIERQTGIQKSMRIALPDDDATVIVDHILTNHNLWPLEFAPWAITKLKPGGTAILPQNQQTVDEDGLQANRSLALWPYTRVNSPHIQWADEYILVEARMGDGAMKLGFPNPRGWLAYWRQGNLFVKWADFNPQAEYYEYGASSQCYCDPENLELETLGPRTIVEPGTSVQHREVWRLFPEVPRPEDEGAAVGIAESLDLDQGRF
jgi:hypothetical protein